MFSFKDAMNWVRPRNQTKFSLDSWQNHINNFMILIGTHATHKSSALLTKWTFYSSSTRDVLYTTERTQVTDLLFCKFARIYSVSCLITEHLSWSFWVTECRWSHVGVLGGKSIKGEAKIVVKTWNQLVNGLNQLELDSEDDYRSGSRNVSHQQQSF